MSFTALLADADCAILKKFIDTFAWLEANSVSISFLLMDVFNVSKYSSQKGFALTLMVIHLYRLFYTTYVYHFVPTIDISYGVENVRVSCVNSIEYSDPPKVTYSTSRLPGKGVYINKEKEFIVCCDCTDDCQDKEKCRCWQLTMQVKNYISNSNDRS